MSTDTAAPEVRTTLSALVWNYSSAVIGTILQLCYTAYTARVVAPQGFGAYVAANAATTVLGYVAGAGLATYLLRSERLTRQTVRTAFLVSAASGTLCCLAVQAVAPLCATLWGLPEIEPTVRLFGPFFLAQPAAFVALAALRRMDLARFSALTETAAQFIGMAIGALLLAVGWSPYGLVLTQDVIPVVSLVVASVRLTRCPLPDGPPVPARAMLGISGAFAGYGMIQMTTTDTALWAVTRFLGVAVTGQFSRATMAVGLPVSLLQQNLRRAVMPSLARINGEGRPLSGALPDVLSAASVIAFGCFGVLAGIGPAALQILLGPGWTMAAGLVPILALGAPFVLLCQVSYAVDEIRKAMGSLLRNQLLVLGSTVAVVAVSVLTVRSLALIAIATAAASGIGHLEQLVRWHRLGLLQLRSLIRPYLIHAAVGAALYGSGHLAAQLGTDPWSQLLNGLMGMVPVALVCVAVRRRLPFYAAAVSRGLVTG